MAKEIAEEYASSLADLTVNSKPLINMLTILAEENVEHAGVIVETVEKHLEKVNPDIKLPILYLVDSIIKNVGGAYTQKFSERIVNIFTRTFKQVDEKIRSQMFKLRETWHEVFPPTKLYQLDVKVNLIDPAWPIQAQPVTQSVSQAAPAIHPNASGAVAATGAPLLTEDEERMRVALAKKEQELLMLQRKKIEMELEHTRRQLELAERQTRKLPVPVAVSAGDAGAGSAVIPVAVPEQSAAPVVGVVTGSARARLGPPVGGKGSGVSRIAPVSAALAAARRDPRLRRAEGNGSQTQPPGMSAPPPPNIAPHVFDIAPLQRTNTPTGTGTTMATKRNNVITYDVTTTTTTLPERGANRDPCRRDPRDPHDPRPEGRRAERRDRQRRQRERARELAGRMERAKRDKLDTNNQNHKPDDKPLIEKPERNDYMTKYQIPDPDKINKLPPIPKISRNEAKDKDGPSPVKKKKEPVKNDKKKVKDANKDNTNNTSSSNSSPEKKHTTLEKRKQKEKKEIKEKQKVEEDKPDEDEMIAFKELKNYHKERYMRRNKEKSESPEINKKTEETAMETDASNVPDVIESKDVDLRVLPAVQPKPVQKRSSTETIEGRTKKTKLDKFDILFGSEDVDLRQLPQVEETAPVTLRAASLSPRSLDNDHSDGDINDNMSGAEGSPKRDWHQVKEQERGDDLDVKKTPSKLDLVRAKLAEATRGKDRLGRPLLFSSSPGLERRRTISSSEDIDLRMENPTEFDAEDHKKTISIIMNQAKQQFSDGQLDKNQYNTLMYQVLQLNEKLKLKEAKQRESLELSKRKLKATIKEEKSSPKSSPKTHNTFGDIDERVPPMFMDTPPDSQGYGLDSDLRMNVMMDKVDGQRSGMLANPMAGPMTGPMAGPMTGLMPGPIGPMGYGPPPGWRGIAPVPRIDEYVPRRFRGPGPFFRARFETRGPRGPFEPLPLPLPRAGMFQGESPVAAYERVHSPPPLGVPGLIIPPTDYRVLEYIDQDPVKTIQIDGVPREIRFYGDTAIIMLDWDDPREIKFLPGCRRVTFDNKDSVVISFNDPYKQVEFDDQTFDIRFGAPTRELYINGRWYECFFGGQPLAALIEGKPHFVQLEGPLPQVDIGKVKRTDLVAGKINLIVNATQMCPVYLDAKVQKFMMNGKFYTIRFVDSLRTVLINEQPFKVEYGDLPKPIMVGNEKFFIRFSALPRGIKPGMIQIANMEGVGVPALAQPVIPFESIHMQNSMEVDEEVPRPPKTPSPDGEHQGLDLLASVMPSSLEAPASASAYSLAEPLFSKPDTIPGLDADNKPAVPGIPALSNINITDLFAKLVATGIVQMPNDKEKDKDNDKKIKANDKDKEDDKEEKEAKKVESPVKPKEDTSKIHRVDLLKPETLRVKQPGLVSRLYGGMQCSGCGARFPPEHTVRYSQHLDWHFRQNRRERDSARRAHSRHWHYDLSDWVQYEEVEDLDEREKSWFETGGVEGEGEGVVETEAEAPSVAAGAPTEYHCALCGDRFQQFYNEDQEEWHLRNSIRHEDKNYHPACFDDYKAALARAVPSPLPVPEEPIVIGVDDNSQSDAESDVELVDDEPKEEEPPVEIDEGDEDDVVFKAEPVEQVTVEDDVDTDDETAAERKERDQKAEIAFSLAKVKVEPIDPDDEPIITAEEETPTAPVESSHTTVLSSIDGNVQLESTPAVVPLGGIRINISKTIPTVLTALDMNKDFEDVSADEEPLPPGEEPELEYTLKPTLEGVQFSRQPPVNKGNELSGLCSIM